MHSVCATLWDTTGVLGVNPDLCNNSTVPAPAPQVVWGTSHWGWIVCFLLRSPWVPCRLRMGPEPPVIYLQFPELLGQLSSPLSLGVMFVALRAAVF